MYLHTKNELGQPTQTAATHTSPTDSLFQRLQNALVSGQWYLAITLAVLSGNRDANQLTNMIFFARHPERGQRKLERSEANFKQLSAEWLKIRDDLVSPYLKKLQASGQSTQSSSPPPDKPGHIISGKRCSSGKGKCWPWNGKSKDIVDLDVPWNGPSHRSPENYIAVIDYFNVGDSENRTVLGHKVYDNDRYRRIDNRTWCNIFVHDVTRAMWANIPHWVKRKSRWSELNANATVQWLDSKEGRNNGWIKIDHKFIEWMKRMAKAKSPLPIEDPAFSEKLRTVAWAIINISDTNPTLLSDAGYVAQKFANQGLPTVTVWENFKTYKKDGKVRRYSGHVAMIRPERSVKGQLIGGKFVPVSAQAGGMNWTNKLAKNMYKKGIYFVHE